MKLKKMYHEFKHFPLLVKLAFIPAIVVGLALIAGFVWLSVTNPLWLVTQTLTALFILSVIKLIFFFAMDYPKLKEKMKEERLEKLKAFE